MEMEEIKQIIEIYNVEITIGTLVAFFVLLALYLIAEIRISKLKNRYNQLVRGIDGINLEELLIENGNKMDKLQDDFLRLGNKVDKLETKLTFAIQKVGFVRYNAFSDMGSELSFSIAFLDNFLNGFVLTSIYGRENSIDSLHLFN